MLLIFTGAALAQQTNFSFDNPAGSQHTVHAPSAIPMGKGVGFVSQKMVFTRTGYAVTDHLELVVTSSPVNLVRGFLSGDISDTVYGGVRLKGSPSALLHLGVGGDWVYSYRSYGGGSDTDTIWMGYGYATYGTADRQVTVGLGSTYTNDNPHVARVGLLASLSGQLRLTDRVGLVTETDVGSWGGSDLSYLGVSGVRLFGRRLTADVGAFYTGLDAWPALLPWLDLTLHLGARES